MESLLGEAGVPVTVLRAAIVVGHGGISWEMTRQLIDRLPVMAAPSWAATRTQPIALADVVRYLVGVLDHPQALGRVFEVGGADVLSYEDMLKRAAVVQNNRDVPVVSVPLSGGDLVTDVVARASAYALSLLTDVDADTARNLIGSMDTEVVVSDSSIDEVVLLEHAGLRGDGRRWRSRSGWPRATPSEPSGDRRATGCLARGQREGGAGHPRVQHLVPAPPGAAT